MSDRSPTPLKIKLTGGEPLLHPTITSLLSDLSTLTPSIGITTNGVLLSRHWPSVSRYISSVNVSLDTVNPEKFNLLTRRKGLNRVMDAVKLASESHRVKVNCVVMRGFNDGVEDFEGILKFCEEAGVECRFIEWMPFSGNNFDGKFVSMSEMKSKIALTGRSITPVETFKTDTTKWVETEGGKVGFISSMSENFCEGCNRVRITCDGNLKVCLFDGTEVSLRDALRAGVSDTELGWIMDNALGRKHFKFAGAEDMHQLAERVKGNRPMTAIGG
ncbi:hypothetical protein TrVE_jg6087 [Triparma verrucosa]|nr:hypothetical protein TrVE_jg6087 [Triparma verrucosa]